MPVYRLRCYRLIGNKSCNLETGKQNGFGLRSPRANFGLVYGPHPKIHCCSAGRSRLHRRCVGDLATSRFVDRKVQRPPVALASRVATRMASSLRSALSRIRGRGSDAAGEEENLLSAQRALERAGGAAAEYTCECVSLDDTRGKDVGGVRSGQRGHLIDSCLKARDGTPLFTVRRRNWDEKLGVVRACDVALLAGNQEGSGLGALPLSSVTLEDFLRKPAAVGARYAGMEDAVCLADASLDATVAIRFQTVFLPVSEGEDGRGRIQFSGEMYSSHTKSDNEPRSIVLLATTRGLSVQCDGKGAKRMLLHGGRKGVAKEYWLEAESRNHAVLGEQNDHPEEREDAVIRRKVASDGIGIKAMGTRGNVLVRVAVAIEYGFCILFGHVLPRLLRLHSSMCTLPWPVN